MTVQHLESLYPERPEWSSRCEQLRQAITLPDLVWIALQLGLLESTFGSGTRTKQPCHRENEVAIVPWLSRPDSVKRIPSAPNVHSNWVHQMKAKSRKMHQ